MNAPHIKAGIAAALLIAGLAYAAVIRPIEGSIAARYADLDIARASLERDAALTQRLPRLLRERAALNTRLMRSHLHDSRAALIDRFLHAIARTARREAVAVQSVAADPRPAEELALDITVRGSYTRLISAIRDLNSADVGTQIALTSLGNTRSRPGTRPQLDATFHVVLLRDTDEIPIHPPRPV